jgi:hypothetical protein
MKNEEREIGTSNKVREKSEKDEYEFSANEDEIGVDKHENS